jgi:hypothetical protein
MDRKLHRVVVLAALAALASSCYAAPNPPTATPAFLGAPQSISQLPITVIDTPAFDAQVDSESILITGRTTAPGEYMTVHIRDLSGSILHEEVVLLVGGSFSASASRPVAVTTPVEIEVFQMDEAGNEIARQTVRVNLLPAAQPAPAATSTQLPQQVLPQTLAPGGIAQPVGLQLTSPDPGARVTFPVHIAGYLRTPGNAEVQLQATLRYGGLEVSDALTTIQWGRINIIAFNLDIPGGVGAHPTTTPATLLIRDPNSNYATLAEQPVTLVGLDQSSSVDVYFINSLTNATEAVERRLPTARAGSNAALAELFWGPSNEEAKQGIATFIPGPREVRAYGGGGSTLNALVHVADMRVAGGVATLALSPSIRAADGNRPDLAAAQIRETLLQFSNVTSVIITVDGYPWQSSGGAIPPTAVLFSTPVAAVTYLDANGGFVAQGVRPLNLTPG